MATLSENITNTITYLDEIRDAIINTGIGMPENTIVADYDIWIKRLIPIELAATISKSSLATADTSFTITITSNSSWSISNNSSWITLSATSGSGNATITATFTKNTTGIERTAQIQVVSTINNYFIVTFYPSQAAETWSTQSYTLSIPTKTYIYNRTSTSDSGSGTWNVSMTSYRTEISNIGRTRNIAVTPTYSESLSFVTNVSISNVSGTSYTATITYDKSIAGTGSVTFSNGTSTSITCTINQYNPPVVTKQMTIKFRQSGINSVYLFNTTVSDMNLSTSILDTFTINPDGSVTLSWTDDNGIVVNTPNGGQTNVKEGGTFVVYYATQAASIIRGYQASLTQTLKDGATVTI